MENMLLVVSVCLLGLIWTCGQGFKKLRKEQRMEKDIRVGDTVRVYGAAMNCARQFNGFLEVVTSIDGDWVTFKYDPDYVRVYIGQCGFVSRPEEVKQPRKIFVTEAALARLEATPRGIQTPVSKTAIVSRDVEFVEVVKPHPEKKVPREFWVNEYSDGWLGLQYPSLAKAIKEAKRDKPYTTLHCREVSENG